MKKRLLLLFAFSVFASAMMSQTDGKPTDPKKKLPKPKQQDLIILNFNWMHWFNAPDKSDQSPFSRGFDVALMYDIPFGRSPISFATGVNFSFENIFLRSFLMDSSSAGNQYLYFQPIEPIINADSSATTRDWKKYKLATAIIELPVEFRFRLKPYRRNTFKIAVGFKIGYVIDSWQKYIGPDYRLGANLDEELRQVTYVLPNINRFRYGVYTRIGYSRYHAYVAYSIGDFFESGKGISGANTFTAGICFTPF